MTPRIELLEAKQLIGMRLTMSLTTNRTGELWSQFSPHIKKIKHKLTTDKISMQVYNASYFKTFNPALEFEKWATMEVANFNDVPNRMETFNLSGGLYAVFDHKGDGSDNRIFQYIFMTWLPNSEYQLDERPHFEVLGDKYKTNDPTSEEEIWIPIKLKSDHQYT